MSDTQIPPRSTATVHHRGDRWIGYHHTPEGGQVAVLLGPAATLDLEQACGRWARALRRGGWLLVDDWAITPERRWASVPLRRLSELLTQQILLAPAAGDRPRLLVAPLHRRINPS